MQCTRFDASHMKALIALFGFLFLILPAASAATGPKTLSLEDALRAAFANNPRVRSALEGIESTAGRAEQRGTWPNPQISFSAEDVPSGNSLSQGKNLIRLSQTVPFPLKPWTEGRIGESELGESRAAYDLFATALERDVKIAFYRALAADQSLAIAREMAGGAEALAVASLRRVEAGDAPLQEQLRAEIELERVRSEVVRREQERALALEDLFTLMGGPPGEVSLAGDLSADTTLVPSTAENESDEPQHPLLAGAAARVDRMEAELRRAKLEPLPDFDLSFATGRDEADSHVLEVEAGISIPLFNFSGGLKREKRADLEAARAELTAAERDLAASRRNAERTFRAVAEQAAAYRDRILPRAEQALALVRGGYDAGKFGFIDLLDTQRTLAEVKLACVEKLFELNSARAEWDALNRPSTERQSME